MKTKSNIKVTLILLGVAVLGLIGAIFSTDMVLFDPKGPIGEAQKSLIITSVLLMAIIIIPVLFMAIYFPYKYRHSNTKAEYKPKWEHSTKIEIVVWAIPCLIILALGRITYLTAFSLDPRQAIESDKPPLTIQVVAM
ncbi:MAG: cytochrome ubiquinol oxidase subunit II, partial [Vibrio metschnikovii]